MEQEMEYLLLKHPLQDFYTMICDYLKPIEAAMRPTFFDSVRSSLQYMKFPYFFAGRLYEV